jgi:hypothetical protein
LGLSLFYTYLIILSKFQCPLQKLRRVYQKRTHTHTHYYYYYYYHPPPREIIIVYHEVSHTSVVTLFKKFIIFTPLVCRWKSKLLITLKSKLLSLFSCFLIPTILFSILFLMKDEGIELNDINQNFISRYELFLFNLCNISFINDIK